MSFAEWFEDEYSEQWHEDYADTRTGYIASIEYEEFCKRNNLEPVWNG
jgi:hypothetical protein